MTSILIADDHPLTRSGIKQFLAEDARIDKVGEASSAQDALEQLHQGHWDLLILDINMPGLSGLAMLQDLKSAFPSLPVLVVSGFPERQYAVNVLRAGAQGYLAKDSAPDDIMKAVRAVLGGRRYISAAVAQLLIGGIGKTNAPLHEKLSAREFKVFSQLAVGMSVGDIAAELSISVKTVSTYRTRLLEKMQLQTNADITSYALRNGIIQ